MLEHSERKAEITDSKEPDPERLNAHDCIRRIRSELQCATWVQRAGFPALSRPTVAEVRSMEQVRVEALTSIGPLDEQTAVLVRSVRQAADEAAFLAAHRMNDTGNREEPG
jgi:hypothetical protein